jgi:hypothetical protein
MATITKKIDKEWFDLIVAGKKKFELRLADFEIKEGDTLRLEEYTLGEDRKPTGRFIEKVVTFAYKPNLKQWIDTQPSLLGDSFYIIQFD